MRKLEISNWLLLPFMLAFTYLVFYVQQNMFWQLILAQLVMFFIYCVWFFKGLTKHLFLTGFILIRIITLFKLPALSDDFYRFLWDGMLTNCGINPYDFIPSDINTALLPSNAKVLLNNMNSVNYYSVYPIIYQYVFALMYAIGAENMLLGVNTYRLLLFAIELILIFLVFNTNVSSNKKVEKLLPLILLNPLYLTEGVLNIHAESLVILLLLIAVVLYRRTTLFAFIASLAIGIKTLPLLIAPLLMRLMNTRNLAKMAITSLVVLLLFIVPFYNSNFFSHQLESMRLYFKVFEFNGSFYNVLRWIGFELYNHNIIAKIGAFTPWLVLIFVLYIQLTNKQIKHDKNQLVKKIMYSFIVYFSLSSIVHPWYVLYVLIPALYVNSLSVLFWTFTVGLSYGFYAKLPINTYSILVVVEYAFLFGGLLIEAKSIRVQQWKQNLFNNTMVYE